jgi:nucleoside-diphosphate-sugar epimerase
MTVYIAGSKGYIGQNLVPFLKEKKYTVVELEHSEIPDMRAYDAVVNLACHGHKPGDDNLKWMIQANTIYPIHLLENLPTGALMVHTASSAEIYRPEMLYSKTKSLGTKHLLWKCHVAYIYSVFGGVAEFPHRFMRTAIEAAATGRGMKLTTPLAIRDYIHMRYILQGIEELLRDQREPKTLHFGSGRPMSMANIVGILRGITGKGLENIEFIYLEKGSEMWEARPPHFPDTDLEADIREEYEKCASATSSLISSGGPASPTSSESPEGGISS